MAVVRSVLLQAMSGLAGLGWACMAMANAGTSAMETRYRCTLPDGDVRVSTQDLSRVFRRAVFQCEAFEVPASADTMWSKQPRVVSLANTRRVRATPFTLVDPVAPLLAGPFKPALKPGWSFSSMASGYLSLVTDASQRYGIDPQLVTALIHVESGFQPRARSPKGALGLMQIMPATGARYGVTNPRSLLDPTVNIDVGTRYLRDLHAMFPGRVDLVLAAYNAGEGAVIKRGHRIPPYPETQDYVRKVLQLLGMRN
jgi:soluble lytic murein transglycosylase-like protein